MCLVMSLPAAAVTMDASVPDVAPAVAQNGAAELVRPRGTPAAETAAPDFGPAAMDPATASLQVIGQEGGHEPGAEGGRLTRAVAADAMVGYESMGSAPVAADDRYDTQAASIADLLRGVVTLHGRSGSAAPGTPRAPAAGAGGDPLSLMLQPLVAELLDTAITSTQAVDGRKVFSVFGGGAFVLEASREGSGYALSELNTGSRIVLGGAPERARRDTSSRAEGRDDTPMPVDGAVPHADGGEMARLMGTFAQATGKLVGTLTWFGESPVRLLMLVPLVLLVAGVEFLRRGTGRTVAVKAPARSESSESSPDDTREGAHRRHRRRRRKSHRRHRAHGKKKSGWRAIIAGILESLGFPELERLREKDFPGRRRRRSRRHARRLV
jgi:hypothetical protein